MLLLQQCRKQRKLTQKALAKLVGISRTQVSFYECGKCSPNVEMLTRFAHALKVSMHALLEEGDYACPLRPDVEAGAARVAVTTQSRTRGNAQWLALSMEERS